MPETRRGPGQPSNAERAARAVAASAPIVSTQAENDSAESSNPSVSSDHIDQTAHVEQATVLQIVLVILIHQFLYLRVHIFHRMLMNSGR